MGFGEKMKAVVQQQSWEGLKELVGLKVSPVPLSAPLVSCFKTCKKAPHNLVRSGAEEGDSREN